MIRGVVFRIVCSFFLLVFMPFAFSDYPATDYYETDFDEIEDPTAEDLQMVLEPTVDDFNRLSFYEQREYLLTEYDTEFAAVFLEDSDFKDVEDRLIAEQYYSENHEHINDNPDLFTAYMEQEGIEITITGPVNDYDEQGNLYGNNQVFNLNNFKNSPAHEEYALVIDPDGTILLSKKDGTNFAMFTGNLKADRTGRFSLKEGTINGYDVREATQLEFNEEGDIAGGKVKEYDGIVFSEPTPIKVNDLGVLHVEDATILSVQLETDLHISGSAKFSDYNTIQGRLTIPDQEHFIVNNMIFFAKGDNVELRFREDPSQDPHVSYARISEDAIILNGGSSIVLLNSQNFVTGSKEPKAVDVIIKPKTGTVTISREDDRLSVTGRDMVMRFKDAVYTTEDGKLYKVIGTEREEGKPVQRKELVDETLYSKLGTEAGTSASIDIHVEEGDGVAFFLEDGYAAFIEEGTEQEKPTIVGTVIQGKEIAAAYLTGDVESLQVRIDEIETNLYRGVGIPTEDKEFLLALFGGISVGGYVKIGPNAGTALKHYFTGNGEELEVDSAMFEESKHAQQAMAQMQQEIQRQRDTGATQGTLSSRTCGCTRSEVAVKTEEDTEIRERTDGVITTSVASDPDLFFTSHNYYLDATWHTDYRGIEIIWSVDDQYDFKGFVGNEAINLPLLWTDQELNLPDGVARAMATELDLAKQFNVHAEWQTTMEE